MPFGTLPTTDRRIAVDANLLLLLVVGAWNPRAIQTQKRLSGFVSGDFDLLRNFTASFDSVVTTPHVLTEVSNLAGAATGHVRVTIFQQLKLLVETLDERFIPAQAVCNRIEFNSFGLTDACLSVLCAEIPLITEDGRLANHLQRKGLQAWTLDHLRALRNFTNNA